MRTSKPLLSLWPPLPLVAVAVPLATAATLMAANSRRWVFDVRATEAWWSLSLILLGPLCATLGSFVTVRRRTSGMDALARTARRPWLDQYSRVLLELGGLVGLGLCVAFSVSMTVTLSRSSAGWPQPLVAVAVVAWCFAFISFGIALGHRFPLVVLPPIAGLLGYAFLVLPLYVTSLHGADRLTPFGVTPSAYSGPSPWYSALQAVVGAGVAFWLLPQPAGPRRILASAGLAGCLVLLAVNGPAAARPDWGAMHVTCAPTARAELCLTASRERDRARLAGALDSALATFGPLYPSDTTVVQTIAVENRTGPTAAGLRISTAEAGLPLETGETLLPSDRALTAQVLYRLAAPSEQRSWRRSTDGPPPADVVIAWAYAVHGLPTDGSACPLDCYQRPGAEEVGVTRFERAVAWFTALTPDQRQAWFHDHRSDLLHGELDFGDFA